MSKLHKASVALGLVLTAVVLTATSALAQTATPADQIESLATDAASQMTPIILAVAGGVVGLAVVLFGARFVLRAVRSGGRI